MQKNTIRLFLALWIALLTINSQAQTVNTPRVPSPGASVSQTIGISTVSVTYSRPSIKGRTVWGELVPYGWNVQQFGTKNLAPWRAGANENTVIEFSHNAKVEGQPVPAGKYGLFMVINKDDSGEVILSKDYTAWGNFFYQPDHDLLRAKIQVRSVPNSTEMLTYDFVNLTKNSAELNLNWEKKQFPVKIEFATDDIVLANAENELKGMKGFQWQAYNSAARYCLQNNVSLEKALSWVDQSFTRGAGAANFDTFGTTTLKSGILTKMGKTAEAEKLMANLLATADSTQVNNYGYQLLGQGQHDKAIEVLTMNTKKYPKSANAWDSLGEACAIKGDNKNAITYFKKSLSLKPTAGTKANSEKYLKQLGAM